MCARAVCAMKLYESVLTYLPFMYFLIFTVLYGSIYHNSQFTYFRPYLILTCGILNAYLRETVLRNRTVVRNILQSHVWMTVITSVFGVLLNNIHHELFSLYHLQDEILSIALSVIYVCMVSLFMYLDMDSCVWFHVCALYVPFRRVWVVNLYMYVLFTCVSIILQYRRCKRSTLVDRKTYKRPILKYFGILRVHEYAVLLGFIQLYLDYRESVRIDLATEREITSLVEDAARTRERIDEEA